MHTKKKRFPPSHKNTRSRRGPARRENLFLKRDIAERAARVANNSENSPTVNVSIGTSGNYLHNGDQCRREPVHKMLTEALTSFSHNGDQCRR